MIIQIFFTIRKFLRVESKFIKTKFFENFYTILNIDSTTKFWYGKEWNDNTRGEFKILLKENINNESLIFNIGAHQGIVAMILNNKINNKGRIVTVEINKKNAAAIKKNFELNNIKNYYIENAAIHEFNDIINFKNKSNARISKFGFSKIKTININQLIDKYGIPTLIYLDVEGSECLALRGAHRFLEKIKYLYIEVHSSSEISYIGGTKEELFKILKKYFLIYYVLEESDSNYLLLKENDTDLMFKNKLYLFCKNKN